MPINLGSVFGRIGLDASDVQKGVKVAVDSLQALNPAMKQVDGSLAQAQAVIKQTATELNNLKATFNASTPKATIEAYNQAKAALAAARQAAKEVGSQLKADAIDADKLKDAYGNLKKAADALPKAHGPTQPSAPMVGPTPPKSPSLGTPTLNLSGITGGIQSAVGGLARGVQSAVTGMGNALRAAFSGNILGSFDAARAAIAGIGTEAAGASGSLMVLAGVLAAVALAVGILVAAAATLRTGLDATRAWGGQVHDLADIFGITDENALGFAAAMNHVGVTVDEGAAGIGYLVRQIAATKDQLADAKDAFGAAAEEIRNNFTAAVEEAATQRLGVWSDLYEATKTIESNLADSIEQIQYDLNEKLADIAYQRAKVDADTTKSLAKLESDTKDKLRNAHSARERRQIRKEAAERKQEILDAAAERKAELDRQEARERAHAARAEALAEKTANKQIEAAQKAADKQIAAIEKALKREEKLRDESLKKAGKSLLDVETKSPLSKALKQLGLTLKDVTDESGNFTEEGLAKIMDAFAKLPEGVKASNIAMQLFGKSGMQWLDFLRLGSKGLDEFRRKALAMGLGVNTDDIKKFNFALNDLRLSFLGIGVTIGKTVLPYAKDFAESLSKGIQGAIPLLQSFLTRMSDAFKKGGLEGLAKEFWKWLTEPKGVFEQIGLFLGKLRAWLETGDGKKLIDGAGKALAGLVDALGRWATSEEGKASIQGATNKIGAVLASALTLFVKTSAEIVLFMTELSARVIKWCAEHPEFFKGMAAAFIKGFQDALSSQNPFKGLPGYGKEPYEQFGKQMEGQGAEAGKSAGGGVSSGIQTGIADGQGDVQTAVTTTTTEALDDARPYLRSPTWSFGAAIDEGIGAGIKSHQYTVWRDLVESVRSALTAARAYVFLSSMSVGESITGGIALGILNNRKVIADSLRAAIILALLQVQGFLGAHSPSTLFADKVGVPMGLGIVQGFEESIRDLRRSMTVNLGALTAAPAPVPVAAAAGNVYHITIAPRFGGEVSPTLDARYKRELEAIVHRELQKVIS